MEIDKTDSVDNLQKRRRQNIITLSGQFATFMFETIFGILGQVMIVFHDTNDFSDLAANFAIIHSAFLTGTFFIASPELLRFYFPN